MKSRKTPYVCHLFICSKSRGGERKSCGDNLAPDLKPLLKDAVNERGWKGRVRISESSCLGVCATGPNIMIYPQNIWLSGVSGDDVPKILRLIEEQVG